MIKGSQHSEESKNKLRISSGGRPKRSLSSECKAKISLSQRGNKNRQGKRVTPHGHKLERKIDVYARRCEERNLSWELTREQARELMIQPCRYCGEEPDVLNATGGIDRLCNQEGYTLLNSAPACKRCNLSKHTMSETEFEAWVERVYQKLQERRHMS